MENEVYVVKENDTILSVAELFGVKVIDLIQANNLEDIYDLTPGEELIIPTTTPLGFTYYTVEKGDNLYQIAKKAHIQLDDLIAINGLETANYIYPGEKILIPKEGVYAYITQDGDTLFNVAQALGLKEDDIITYNPRIYLLPEQLIAYKIQKES